MTDVSGDGCLVRIPGISLHETRADAGFHLGLGSVIRLFSTMESIISNWGSLGV